ncbi:MAG: hypothetical protein A2312_02455 [Candidatus Staskawiczbacteria bacterium RIFOXYB2_FULL_32_9]|uniref:General secretion pathway GspH domain-containing protein n=1 Tax=Candidatus Staskawiczbacteria bacterium RIFOXYD1_FULL_32_13 TaxID=1802234 RepID=A0A1G2JPF6_9BACT|nr:MAG: hypothetical protein A2360_01290 [Candidatus Staskawiczbacteria bacterium RIFOXYB1_FULL_32_11]OGZ80989.1 MAG: hypothetical protein A2312_02455 [Candidatus Staskawiczbacteria bacterium RIFOXYB2_FULL_32_9]OGZ88051.1 MAG: hypothetical protein A2463_00375 [Candidatus Staskawiczbacteria bacterium RIFOXYC2_FULL_32_10]OGZ88341.1 MAG: hypothetical protein A2561_01950 [Candidatus Staskawiczbacteria bacterium RIFOXYD1_FULL_32_13]
MVFKFSFILKMKYKILNKNKGITLIEIIVIISIISILSAVIVADFPSIRLQLNLSRAVHIISQDLKTAQSQSSSGSFETLSNGEIIYPKGYGVYFDSAVLGNKKYIIYADIDGDRQYNVNEDFVSKEIDLSLPEPGIIIKEIHNGTSRLSINFAPPNFNTTITNLLQGTDTVEIVIAIESKPETTRTIYVNKSGLIWY